MALIDRYPEFLQRSATFTTLQDAMDGEVQKLRNNLKDLLAQCFVATATWGLTNWERQVGIVPDESKSNDVRRAAILAKLQKPPTITPAWIEATAEEYGERTAAVSEDYTNYSFTIHFGSPKGIPTRQAELEKIIEQYKPAHLGVVYNWTFTIHQELKPYTHKQISQWTHDGIRTEDSL